MDNLSIYNKLRTVPQEAKKEIRAGRLKGMTDINPMWRIMRLTEEFGPCGVGWWYEVVAKWIEADEITQQKAGFVDINLYIVDPVSGEVSHPIPGTGGASFVSQEKNGPYLSDEVFKMALTDAISVACKALGMAADVYFENGRSKYSGGEDNPPRQAPPAEPTKFVCNHCGKVLAPYKDRNGKDISIRQHAAGSEKKFGQVLCIDCIRQFYADSVRKDDADATE